MGGRRRGGASSIGHAAVVRWCYGAKQEVNVKKFLVLYESSMSAREEMARATPEQQKAGMDMWMQWAAKTKSHIVELGQPVGDGKHVAQNGHVSEARENIGGYSILQAASLDEAVKLLHEHPHFHSPNGAISVLELMPIPGM
jgi:hypothetical protein